jgi:hypothetical protein
MLCRSRTKVAVHPIGKRSVRKRAILSPNCDDIAHLIDIPSVLLVPAAANTFAEGIDCAMALILLAERLWSERST